MILLLGYGNLLCGDDGIGPYIVEWLANADAKTQDHIEYIGVRQLTPELVEPISRADAVIFVDATCAGTPGEIICRELEPTPDGALIHHFDAARLLEGVECLYGKTPMAYRYTVAGQNFKMGDPFSPIVKSVLPLLLNQLRARIVQCANLVSVKQ